MEELETFKYKTTRFIKTDFVLKNCAGCIDAFLILIFYCISFIVKISFFIPLPDSHKILYIFILFMVYRLVSIMAIKRTLGMLLLGIVFAKEDRTPPNAVEKLCAALMIYVNTIDCYTTK